MTDRGVPREMPTASVRARRPIPLVWIVPALTALIALWLAWDTWHKKGPVITVTFETAAGLTAGQSQLKYKNVVMGTVKSIDIAPAAMAMAAKTRNFTAEPSPASIAYRMPVVACFPAAAVAASTAV